MDEVEFGFDYVAGPDGTSNASPEALESTYQALLDGGYRCELTRTPIWKGTELQTAIVGYFQARRYTVGCSGDCQAVRYWLNLFPVPTVHHGTSYATPVVEVQGGAGSPPGVFRAVYDGAGAPPAIWIHQWTDGLTLDARGCNFDFDITKQLPSPNRGEDRLSGSFVGQYACGGRNSVLQIDLNEGEGREVTGLVTFTVPEGTGRYLVLGRYIPDRRRLRLLPGGWRGADPPSGYQAVALEGTFDEFGRKFEGRVLNPNCGRFITTRK